MCNILWCENSLFISPPVNGHLGCIPVFLNRVGMIYDPSKKCQRLSECTHFWIVGDCLRDYAELEAPIYISVTKVRNTVGRILSYTRHYQMS